MSKNIALLRGINVGGNNKVPMQELKSLFESLGYENVVTYINSGNVLFEAGKEVSVATLEKAIKKNFGFDIHVLLRSEKDFKKLLKNIPQDWLNDTEQKTDILFLKDEYNSKKSLDLLSVREGVDNIKYVSGAIIWNIKREDYGKSGMSKLVGTVFYKNITIRNVNTVRKLATLLKIRH